MTWTNRQLVAASVVLAVLLLGAVAFVVVGPDRDACKTAISSEVTRAFIADRDVTEYATENDAAVKSRLRWPCRFQSDAEMETVAGEVMAARWPELFAKGLEEAFSE